MFGASLRSGSCWLINATSNLLILCEYLCFLSSMAEFNSPRPPWQMGKSTSFAKTTFLFTVRHLHADERKLHCHFQGFVCCIMTFRHVTSMPKWTKWQCIDNLPHQCSFRRFLDVLNVVMVCPGNVLSFSFPFGIKPCKVSSQSYSTQNFKRPQVVTFFMP